MALVLCLAGISATAHVKPLQFFVQEGLKISPALAEIKNMQQYFHIQNEMITAQNKKPQIGFTGDYLLSPFLFDGGRSLSITTNPSAKAYGYDAALTNGGLFAAQLNLAKPLFNSAFVKRLYEQNKIQADINYYGRKKMEHDLAKANTDKYIITYTFLEQTIYLQKINEQLQNRKPLVSAMV